ncbi:MAG: signal peptide peptidase SppA [Chthoniobacteraceae bacterium]
MNNQRSGCLSAALVVSLILLGLSALLNFVLVLGSTSGMGGTSLSASELPKFEERLVVPASGRDPDKIAVIPLRGLISGMSPGTLGETMVDDIKLQLRQAANDSRVKAVVLHVDSPGGEVTASDTIYNAVRNFRDDIKKPVVVYMGSLAASGGYYVSCGASWIVANETTFTGSIGVIMSSLNYRGLMDKVGLESIVIKSGKMKDMLSGSREMTEEERAYLQGLIMQTYGKFVGIVARERKLPEEQLRNGIADGRVLSGKDAFAEKLVDQLGEIETAYAKAGALGGTTNAAVIRYQSPFAFARLFRLLGENDGKNSAQSRIEINLGGSLLPKLEAGKPYYLPSFYAP